MIDKFKQLIEDSEHILITAHLNSDGDSVSSGLLLYETLRLNYPDKTTSINYEEISPGLEFVQSFSEIKQGKLAEAIKAQKSDLLIIVDANNIARCSRQADEAKEQIKNNGTKIAIIDHHEPADKDESKVYINQGSPAVVQDIYEICFDHLNLKKPAGYAQTAMLGLFTDTGGFRYDNPRYAATYKMATELIEAGANIEQIYFQVHRYSKEALSVLAELIKNISAVGDGTYTYVSDEFVSTLKDRSSIKAGADIFMNEFMRNVENRTWGFSLYQDVGATARTYKLSLRAITGGKNVAEIARALGGGGHKQAAGAQIEANSLQDALKTVLDIVE